jgi:hypothetical protein
MTDTHRSRRERSDDVMLLEHDGSPTVPPHTRHADRAPAPT